MICNNEYVQIQRLKSMLETQGGIVKHLFVSIAAVLYNRLLFRVKGLTK